MRLDALAPLAAELDIPPDVLDQLIRDNDIRTSYDNRRYSVDGIAREELEAIVERWKAERSTPRYAIEAGWLVQVTDKHNCAGGTPEASGIHEPDCGIHPIMTIEALHELLHGVRRREYAVQVPGFDEMVTAATRGGAAEMVRMFARTGTRARVMVRDVLTTAWRPDVEPPFPGNPVTTPAGGA